MPSTTSPETSIHEALSTSEIILTSMPPADESVTDEATHLYLSGDGALLEYAYRDKSKRIVRATIEAADLALSNPEISRADADSIYSNIKTELQGSLSAESISAIRNLIATRKHGYSWSTLLALLSMSSCTFALGTNEFVVSGILPQIANAFSISIPTAAWMTSAFILGVGFGAPVLAVLTNKLNRKTLLLGLMTLFILATVGSALSPSYPVLLATRIIQAFSHGTFFGVSPVVAGSMTQSTQRASAISLVFTGLTLSNVIGVPLGTEISIQLGWRNAFWAVTGLAGLGLLGMLFTVPRNLPLPPTSSSHALSILKKPSLWLAFSSAAFGYAGMLTSYTYVAKIMEDLSGFTDRDMTWLTALYGIGTVIGNIAGGKAADKALMPSVYSLLTALALVLTAYVFSAHNKISSAINLFFLGLAGFSLISPLMRFVMSKAKEAETLASSMSILGFGVGIALGVYLAGLSIDKGLGYDSPNWLGASLAALGLLLAIITEKIGPCLETTSTAPTKLDDSSAPTTFLLVHDNNGDGAAVTLGERTK
jgi:DHA1 family inner membrane transport protein